MLFIGKEKNRRRKWGEEGRSQSKKLKELCEFIELNPKKSSLKDVWPNQVSLPFNISAFMQLSRAGLGASQNGEDRTKANHLQYFREKVKERGI